MSTTTVRPDATRAGAAAYTVTGAASAHAATSDSSDASYVRKAATGTASLLLAAATTAIGGTQAVRRVRCRARAAGATDASKANLYLGCRVGGVNYTGSAVPLRGAAAIGEIAGPWVTAAPDGSPWDQDRIDGLLVQWTDYGGAGDASTLYEAYVDVDLASAPTTTVTAPTGTITSTTLPDVAWTYADGEGDAQAWYQVRVFSSAQFSVPGFDPEVAAPTWDSGVVSSIDTTTTVGEHLVNGVWRVYVQTAKAVNGQPFWSGWAYSTVTLAVIRQPAPTLAGSWDAAAGRVTCTVEGDYLLPGYASQAFELQRSSDAGVTWRDVRNATELAPLTPDGEALLRSAAVLWIDSQLSPTDGQTITNLGTGGTALNARAGSSVSADSNDPKRLTFEGVPYVYLPAAANYLAASASSADYVDLDVLMRVALDDWTPGTITSLVEHTQGADPLRVFRTTVNTNGTLGLTWYTAGTGASFVSATSTVAPGFVDGQAYWVRVTARFDVGGSREVKFWTAPDSPEVPESWTQLGSTLTGAPIVIPAVTALVGFNITGIGGFSAYRGIVRSSIDGPAIIDIDTSVLTSASASTFTAVTGQTVTINRSSSGKKAAAVIAPVWLFGTDDYLEVPDSDLLDFAPGDSFTAIVVARMWGTFAPQSNVVLSKRNSGGAASAGWEIVGYNGASSVGSRIFDGALSTSPSQTLVSGALSVMGLVRDTVADTIAATMGTGKSAIADTTTASLANSVPLRVGANADSTFYCAQMELVAAAVFRRALTPAELAQVIDYYSTPRGPWATSVDYEAPRGGSVLYRARTLAVDSLGTTIASPWSTPSTVPVTLDTSWWFKPVTAPSLAIAAVRVEAGLDVRQTVQQGVFRPIGRDGAIVVDGGAGGLDGSYTVHLSTRAEWEALRALLDARSTVLVQDPFGEQKLVRFGERSLKQLGTYDNPQRVVQLDYVEVDA
jgi:hypothetical protein